MFDFAGKRITVMGLGRFGGGVGVTRWLASRGANICISDMDSVEKLGDSLTQISDLIDQGRIDLHLAGHHVEDFTNCDLLVVNPAVPKPWENQFINAALGRGVPVTTEIQLLTERLNRHRTIGITGSAGKSTTSAMIHHILKKTGCRTHFGGNIGGSLLDQVDRFQSDDWVVLELSSAMLHWLGASAGTLMQTETAKSQRGGWSPHIAVITNIAPNHLDWHGSFDHYRESKLNITRFQQPGDVVIQKDVLPVQSHEVQLATPGGHNQLNARFAIAAVKCALRAQTSRAPEFSELADLLVDFPGLPHRLQLIAARDGMRFFNDSKSTTPDATALAVAAFAEASKVHLIAGGYDKGSDLSKIAELSPRIAGLYTIGRTGARLAAAAKAQHGYADYCETLDIAVARALRRMQPRDVLLLSPGCASWDQFTNYEERGRRFSELVSAGADNAAPAGAFAAG